MLVGLSAMAEILGFSHQVLMPTLAKDILQVGAEGLGVMNALRSIGGILAILLLSAMGDVRRKGVLYLIVLHLFGISLVFLGFATTFYMAILGITLVNGMGALSDILSQSLVQSVVPNEFRGRAMGSWTLAVGMGPLGHLQVGALAATIRGDICAGDSRNRTTRPCSGKPGPTSQAQKAVGLPREDGSDIWKVIEASANRDSSLPTTPITIVSVRRVLAYFVPYKARSVYILLCIAASAVLGLIPPLLIRTLIDQAIPDKDLTLLSRAVPGNGASRHPLRLHPAWPRTT